MGLGLGRGPRSTLSRGAMYLASGSEASHTAEERARAGGTLGGKIVLAGRLILGCLVRV